MSYFEDRIYGELGITEEQNNVLIHTTGRFGIPNDVNMPIFKSTRDDDIEILVYTLDRELIEYEHPKADPYHPNIYEDRKQYYHLTRLNPAKVTANGNRYLMPKGQGVYPFIPPTLLTKYEEKTPIDTLVLTEGFFKAFKASIHGLDIVGFSSISHYASSRTKKMHPDVIRIIETCHVKNVVMLYDGDCLNISTKAMDADEDLAKRPQNFLSSMLKIRELLVDYNVAIWFAHVNSENLKDEPKGLDDLLCSYRGIEADILADLLQLEKQGYFFYRMNVSVNAKKLQSYFNLKSAEQFYGYWSDVIKDKEFIYFGTKYKVNEKGKLEKTMPKELRNFMRVGDEYYEMVEMPTLYGTDNISIEGDTEIRMFRRKKETIREDFGKEALTKIPKYKAFINMPSHTNYQQVIKNCYNQYAQIKHEPEEGDWTTIEFFLRHIFGEQYELGIDYLQILYQYPTQMLPILCLVSEERQTGKTTFLDFLKMIFGENCAKVGNDEITNQFNSFLTSRLIVGVDETNLEKNRSITERIKMLSTTNRVFSQSKGIDYTEQWHFAKYILTSNFETNFIYTQENEIRFWVRKVPHIDRVIPTLLTDLHDEIPAFLFFLNNRKISVPKTTRMWFEAKDLETEALRKLKEKQKPLAEREIVAYVRELFTDFPAPQYLFTVEALQQRIPSLQKKDSQHINSILKENLNLVKYRKEGREITTRFKLPRYSSYVIDNDDTKLEIAWDSFHGRPYVFPAEKFLTTSELQNLLPQIDPQKELFN